jgi:hypothetical protein
MQLGERAKVCLHNALFEFGITFHVFDYKIHHINKKKKKLQNQS